MILNEKFNSKLEPLINSSESLANWFERNQFAMAYLGLTHPNCLHFENSRAHYDIVVLGRMTNICLTYLEFYQDEDEVKVEEAIKKMAEIYKNEKDNLSDTVKEKFKISSEPSKKNDYSHKELLKTTNK